MVWMEMKILEGSIFGHLNQEIVSCRWRTWLGEDWHERSQFTCAEHWFREMPIWLL